MKHRENDQRRRANTERVKRDTNPLLDAVRVWRDRVYRWWIDGVMPRGETLYAATEAATAMQQAPRWSDEQVSLLSDLLYEAAERGDEDATDMLADLESANGLIWLGGEEIAS